MTVTFGLSRVSEIQRQPNREHAAFSSACALRFDAPIVKLDERPKKGEPDPHAAVRPRDALRALHEEVEYPR